MRRLALALLVAISGIAPAAQEISLEYRVKAAYLYNFVKYVEWPDSGRDSILICVAGQNPFGTLLDQILRNERIRGKSLRSEVILEPRPDCDVLFTPRTSNVTAYLRAAAGLPVLTVGESPRFLEAGGIVNFVLDGTSVRFEINRMAALDRETSRRVRRSRARRRSSPRSMRSSGSTPSIRLPITSTFMPSRLRSIRSAPSLRRTACVNCSRGSRTTSTCPRTSISASATGRRRSLRT